MTNEQFEQFMMEIGHVFNKWSLGEALVYVRDEPAKKVWLTSVCNDGKPSTGFAVINTFLISNMKEMSDFVLYEKIEITK